MRIELIADINGEPVKGLSQMKELADLGDMEALNLLGEWMMMGFECSPDPYFYYQCFKTAALEGNTQAMINLAVCYMEGYGSAPDFYAAKRWIMAAIEENDSEAVLLLPSLYLTTIGSHKPDVDEYVETLYQLDPTGQALFSLESDFLSNVKMAFMNDEEKKDEIKKRLCAHFVGDARGKTTKEIKKLKNDLTQADIEGFARLRDIHYDDAMEAVGVERDIDVEVNRIINNIREYIVSADRDTTVDVVLVLNKLNKSSDKGLADDIFELFERATGYLAEDGEVDLEEDKEWLASDLDWDVQAKFEIDAGLFSSVDKNVITQLMAAISQRLDELDSDDIAEQYEDEEEDGEGDWHGLYDLIDEIEEIEYYNPAVVSEWVKKIESRIAELQDSMFEKTYSQTGSDYFGLVDLYWQVNDDEVLKTIQDRWLDGLNNAIIGIQRAECEKLCQNAERKTLSELQDTYNRLQQYEFDKKTLSGYITTISELIEKAQNQKLEAELEAAGTDYDAIQKIRFVLTETDTYTKTVNANWIGRINVALEESQRRALDQLVKDVDSMSYPELIETRRRAQHYAFKPDVFEAAITHLDSLINNYEISELGRICADIDVLSAAQLEALQHKIESLMYRNENTKSYLSRIASVYAQKSLLEQCAPHALAELSPGELDQLMKKVHFSDISGQEKESIFDLVNKNKDLYYNCEDRKREIYNQYSSMTLMAKSELSMIGLYGRNKFQFEKITDWSNKEIHSVEYIFYTRGDSAFDSLLEAIQIDNPAPHANVSQNDIIMILSAANSNLGRKIIYFTQEMVFCKTGDGHVGIDLDEFERIDIIANTDIRFRFKEKNYIDFGFAAVAMSLPKIEALAQALTRIVSWFICKRKEKEIQFQNVERLYKKKRAALLNLNEISSNSTSDDEVASIITDDALLAYLYWRMSSQEMIMADDCDLEQLVEIINVAVIPKPIKKALLERLYAVQAIKAEHHAAIRKLYIESGEHIPQRIREQLQPFVDSSWYNIGLLYDEDDLAKAKSHLRYLSLRDSERIFLIFDAKPSSARLEYGFILTNLRFAVCAEDVLSEVFSLRDDIEVKATGLSKITVKCKGSAHKFDASNIGDRKSFASAINKCILWAKVNEKITFEKNVELAAEYSEKYDVCFEQYPLPNEAVDYTKETICSSRVALETPAVSKNTGIEITTEVNSIAMPDHEQPIQAAAHIHKESSAEEIPTVVEKLKSKIDSIDRTKPIQQQLQLLQQLYGDDIAFHAFIVGTPAYEKKINKAIASYAPIFKGEKPLLLEDFTIFGSAKEGFVLTDRNVYLKDMFSPKVVFPVNSVRSVKYKLQSKNLCNINLETTDTTYRLSTRSNEDDAQRTVEFYNDVFILLNEALNNACKLGEQPVPIKKIPVANNRIEKWSCSCGKISLGNFCPKCGKPRGDSTPLWVCACGTLNKGNFCSKCGRRNEKGE